MEHGWANAVRWVPPNIYQLRYEDDSYHDAPKESIPEAILDQAQRYPWSWVRFTGELVTAR